MHPSRVQGFNQYLRRLQRENKEKKAVKIIPLQRRRGISGCEILTTQLRNDYVKRGAISKRKIHFNHKGQNSFMQNYANFLAHARSSAHQD